MNIEIAEHARMSERGSSLLRLIQNNDMPLLDLLVRESIQNSLDAALDGDGYVNVDFNVKEFRRNAFNEVFEGIAENLNRRYPNEQYKLIEVRDSNTTGLTGPIQASDVIDNHFGNLLKLIYEISMPQQQEGAGGSWGLGKTVYFRIGIGLVIYYTRIKLDDGSFGSRMAACLVEDESKKDVLLSFGNANLRRGIAWWGKGKVDNTTTPITDQNEIEKLLSIFNIEPFNGSETGTSIIIPYIDESRLLEGILPSNGGIVEKTKEDIWWLLSVEDYLRVAVQRWYAPRLMNPNYKNGRWLRTKINDEGISRSDMLPIFRVVQSLYNKTSLSGDEKLKDDILDTLDVSVVNIELRRVFEKGGCAGYIAFVKMTREQLLMNHPVNNASPYIHLNKFELDSDQNRPIIMYTRKPGMIVGYETSGNWADGIQQTPDHEFVIGFFIANSFNILKEVPDRYSFEEYIRNSEKADHASWTDVNIGSYKPNLISKIQYQIKKKISEKYVVNDNDGVKKYNMGLGKALAEVLLPPENFGGLSTAGGSTTGNTTSTGNKTKGYSIKITDEPEINNNEIKLNFEIACGKKKKVMLLELMVRTEAGNITAEKWEKADTIGSEFPLGIKRFEIIKLKTGKNVEDTDQMIIDEIQPIATKVNLEISFVKTATFGINYGVEISVPKSTGQFLIGSLLIKSQDHRIQAGLNLNQIGGESN